MLVTEQAPNRADRENTAKNNFFLGKIMPFTAVLSKPITRKLRCELALHFKLSSETFRIKISSSTMVECKLVSHPAYFNRIDDDVHGYKRVS